MVEMRLDEIPGTGVFDGVRVAYVGEDADTVVAFTHDEQAALAAARDHARTELSEEQDFSVVSRAWVRVVDNCGCGAACACNTTWEEDWHDCEYLGLPPCYEEEYAWMTDEVPEGTRGALPMTTLKVKS